jgi:hypothetical protein
MPWKPSVPGEVPTLGYQVIDWFSAELNSPDAADGRPLVLTREQEDYVLQWYALDPETGRFLRRRGVMGRPRGWGKSPIVGAIAIAEGLFDVVPAGWGADGRPVGMPWSAVRTPLIDIAAVSESQTSNSWDPMIEMLQGPVQDDYPGLEPLGSVVYLPVGRIEKITASHRTVKGRKTTFGVLDQTEEWVPSNGGVTLAQTIRTNAAKVGGRTMETPNAYIPGERSVAEASAEYWAKIREGRARDDKLLYDHREAPADTDLTDRASIIHGLRVAYGDSSDHPDGCVIHDPPCAPGWSPIEEIADMFWDPGNDVQKLRSDFLNQITHASDSWVPKPEWVARENVDMPIADGDTIVLGFDGSRGRSTGKADATALVGCRVSDGHMFEIRVWEQPDGPGGEGWTTPVKDVEATLRDVFERFRVVAFYADPSGWAAQVADWDATYGRRLKVKATGKSPIAVWPTGKGANVVEHVKRLHDAIVGGEMTHDGGPSLTRHVLNARRRATRTGYLLYKAFPDSPDKIDAAYAAVMAWKARLDAVGAGVSTGRPKRSKVVVMG